MIFFLNNIPMKTGGKLLAVLVAGLAMSACATLNVREINDLDRIAFVPLQLDPDVEPTDLWIEVIRQTREETTGEGKKTVDVPNDPLGFNLGNGLFYDLNENFSLRLDCLLGFSNYPGFTLKKATTNSFFNNGLEVYKYANDSLGLTRADRTRTRPQYHTEGPADSLSYLRKNNFKYAVVERDSALVYRNKRKVKEAIYTQDENHYYLQRRRRKIGFSQQGNEINLQENYLVALSNGDRTITIYALRRRGRRVPCLTIERSQNKVFVYDRKYRGRKLEFSGNALTIYENKKPVARYELEIPKKAVSTRATP